MDGIEQLVALAGRHGLTLNASTVRTTSSGLDFLVAFASDADGVNWVLRVPRRPDALGRARKERPVLDLVAKHLPVQVPRWEICSDELIGYHQLDGLPVGTVDMEAKAYVWRIDEKNVPPVLEKTLAAAMAALHAIDPAEAAAAGLSVLTPGELRSHMHGRMLRARAEFGDALRRLILAYGDVGGRVWPRMFDHIIELGHTYGVTVAEFALSSGLDEYRQMARQCLGVAD